MKMIPRWRWENIWLIFILTSCLLMPAVMVSITIGDWSVLHAEAPRSAVVAAAGFGFAWGFGAILFGLSVDRLGVSLANSLVIGLSSALGSLLPLVMQGALRLEPRQIVLFLGIVTFLVVVACRRGHPEHRVLSLSDAQKSHRFALLRQSVEQGAGSEYPDGASVGRQHLPIRSSDAAARRYRAVDRLAAQPGGRLAGG